MRLGPASFAPVIAAARASINSLAFPLVAALLLVPSTGHAVPFDGRAKILLHAMPPSGKNVCARAQLADCRDAVTAAATSTPTYVYILVARGPLADFAGMEVGVTYQDRQVGNAHDYQGLDILSWTQCATLEFPMPSPAWPEPGSGNLLSWNTDTVCQTGETAVAGYFYVNAYGPDVLRLIPRPASGFATVADCAAVETHLALEDLGSITFSAGGTTPGCNPCVESCPDPLPPECLVTPASVDFGPSTSAVTRFVTVKVRNTGGGTMHVQPTSSSDLFPYVGQAAFDLTSYQSYSFKVGFAPAGYGTYTGQLDLGTGCPPVPLSGSYIAQPPPGPQAICHVYPQNYDFGWVPVGQTESRRFIITNEGTAPYSGQITENCGAFTLTGGGAYVVNPGQADTFYVNFTPPGETRYVCNVAVGFTTIRVEGAGGVYVPPECHVGPAILDFGPLVVGRSTTWSFDVWNLGGDCVDINPIIDPDCHNFRWASRGGQNDACGWWPIPVYVEFIPTAPIAYECAVTAGFGCPPVILRGQGRLPGAGVISPDSISFGTIATGTVRDTTIVLTNTGGATITGSLDEFCGEFAVVGNAAYSLAPGQSATYHIQFQPNQPGTFRCVIDGGADATVMPCTGKATEGAVPVQRTTWSDIKTRHL